MNRILLVVILVLASLVVWAPARRALAGWGHHGYGLRLVHRHLRFGHRFHYRPRLHLGFGWGHHRHFGYWGRHRYGYPYSYAYFYPRLHHYVPTYRFYYPTYRYYYPSYSYPRVRFYGYGFPTCSTDSVHVAPSEPQKPEEPPPAPAPPDADTPDVKSPGSSGNIHFVSLRTSPVVEKAPLPAAPVTKVRSTSTDEQTPWVVVGRGREF